jgi:hypothetical protein
MRHRLAAYAVTVASSLLVALSPALATGPHLDLSKIQDVVFGGVFIAGDKPCNVDPGPTERALKFILNTARIGFTTWDASLGAKFYEEHYQDKAFLTVAGGTLAIRSAGCVYHFEVKITAEVEPTTIKATGAHYSGSVEMWSSGYFGFGPSEGMSSQIAKVVEEVMKDLVNDRAEDIERAKQGDAISNVPPTKP